MTICTKEHQVSDFPRTKEGLVHGLFQDLTGQAFGRLTVVSYWGMGTGRMSYWNCVCDCGNTSITQAKNLRSGHATSCGCYSKERVAETNTKHGMYHHPLYGVWKGMNDRCNNPNHIGYHRYGGFADPETETPKPVKVCDEWHSDNPEDGALNFCQYMDTMMPIPSYEKYPSGKHVWTLDRIDPDGHYEPSNVKWSTASEQQKNKRCHKAK